MILAPTPRIKNYRGTKITQRTSGAERTKGLKIRLTSPAAHFSEVGVGSDGRGQDGDVESSDDSHQDLEQQQSDQQQPQHLQAAAQPAGDQCHVDFGVAAKIVSLRLTINGD